MTPKQLHTELMHRLRTNKGQYISEAAQAMGFTKHELYKLFTPTQIQQVVEVATANTNYRTGRKSSYTTLKRTRELHTAYAAEHMAKLAERDRQVIEFVAKRNGMLPTDVLLPCRLREVVEPRQQVQYVFREVLGYGLEKVGQKTCIGRLDHTTVMHSVTRATELCRIDDTYNANLTAAVRFARTLVPIGHAWPKVTALHALTLH